MAADTDADCQQVLRHLGETHPSLPLWRRQRPALHLDSAEALFNTADASAQGTVAIRCCCCVTCVHHSTLSQLLCFESNLPQLTGSKSA